MYRISEEIFAKTEKLLDLSHYDLSVPETKGGIVIYCVDGRFYKPDNSLLEALVKKLGWEYYDLVIEPGGIRVLASHDPKDAEERRSVVKRIKTNVELHCEKRGIHGVNMAYVDHHDCGGYGYVKAFTNLDAQYRRFALDLERAEEVTHNEIVPEARVKLFVVMDDGTVHPLVKV